jgi:ankyrin repeat protein
MEEAMPKILSWNWILLSTIGFVLLNASAVAFGAPIDKPTQQELDFLDAAMDGNVELVKEALESGVNVNATYEDGTTALMQAVAAPHIEVMQILFKANADINARSSDGMTAFIVAADQCGGNGGDPDIDEPYYQAIRLLAKAGADINAKDNDGKSAMSYAREFKHQGLIDLLNSLGAN